MTADPQVLSPGTGPGLLDMGIVEKLSESKRQRVVVILPRGETIRNFVYTNALDLVAQEADLTLLSVIPDEKFRDLLADRYKDVREMVESRDSWKVRITRDLLDVAHGKWLWSAAARERWRLRDLEADTLSKRFKRLGKKIASYPFASRAGLDLLSNIECRFSRASASTDRYAKLYERLKPSLVFNSSHIHSRIALPAVHAARRLGIPTATFLFSWDNLTSQGRIMPPYDYYLVWNEAIRDQLLSIYRTIRPEQVFVTGTPQFDFHFNEEFYWSREEFCRRVGAAPDRPLVLYSTGMAHHMPDEPLIVERIADMLGGMKEFGPPQLMVRVYAKDTTSRFEDLKGRRPDILFPPVPWESAWLTPRFEDNYILTNTLRHSALGINIASTISLEMCMFDKPVINVAYNPPTVARERLDNGRFYSFEHYRPVVESGAVRVAWSESEMEKMILDALANPHRDQSLRRAFINEMFGDTLDGRSAERIAERLKWFARKNIAAYA
jgi:hypothetical protein